MQLFNFLLSIGLLAVGVVLTLYLAWVMIAPLLDLVNGGLKFGSGDGDGPERAPRKKRRRAFGKLRKAASRLEKIDTLIANHKCQEALKQLRKTVLLDVFSSEDRIEAVKEHHQNVLSRCLILAEEMGSRAENIPEVERLFIERTELQTLLHKARESYRSLKSRREQAGKNLPSWSKADFDQRVKEIDGELQRNEKSLQEALEKLFKALAEPVSENIVYH